MAIPFSSRKSGDSKQAADLLISNIDHSIEIEKLYDLLLIKVGRS